MIRYSKSFIIVFVILILSYPIAKTYETHHRHLPVFGLLIPAGSEKAISTELWLRAASEEGVPLQTVTYDGFANPFQTQAIESKAILIPDEVSQNASPTLISYLQEYVNLGGRLILVGDALMHDSNGRLKESLPAEVYFQFPHLEGRQGDTIQYSRDTIRITDEWKRKLQIPPGQYSPADAINAPFREFCTYQSLHAKYPHWKTETKPFTGTTLLDAGDGSLIAGIQKIGKGQALWINLPLSYLKRRTDGLLMHSFLRWISEDWLGLPRLLTVPNGVGGIVLNVHVDSNAALPFLTQLKNQGFFREGPFSIHVTAGPDTRSVGDGLGFNLIGSKESQNWIHYWLKQGHEVGSHGGWIHDYFGLNIKETESPEFVNYLEKNYQSILDVAKRAPVEYSAPLGNQPLWVNDWLRKKGYRSYYFVGDNGMGPTQNFRDLVFTDKDLWSFPIASYKQIASFEEAEDSKIPKKEMTTWLNDLTEYVVNRQAVRLFYFHPPGIRFYQDSLNQWLKINRKLAQAGRFKWYTMNGLSEFLSKRSNLSWAVNSLGDERQFELRVKSAPDLREMVWRFNKSAVKDLKVTFGKAQVKEHGDEFEIQSQNDESFSVRYEEVANAP
jgi:hypothetical protein